MEREEKEREVNIVIDQRKRCLEMEVIKKVLPTVSCSLKATYQVMGSVSMPAALRMAIPDWYWSS
jgi:hypothetical protein